MIAKYKFTFGIATLLALSLLATASADNNSLEQNCSETYLYYNPGATEMPNLNVPQITNDPCPFEHHLVFPGEYKPEHLLDANNPEPIKTTADGDPGHQPSGYHAHKYINESTQELNDHGKDFFKFTILRKFEMQLEDDFMANVDLNDVRCPNLPDDNNCQGISYIELQNDGTKYWFINTFNKQTGVISWEFPGDDVFNAQYNFAHNLQFAKADPGDEEEDPDKKEYIWFNPGNDAWDADENGVGNNPFWQAYLINGKNPYLFNTILNGEFGITTEPDSDRQLERSVDAETKDTALIGPEWSRTEDDRKVWSGTITSRVLIKKWQAEVATGLTHNDLDGPNNDKSKEDIFFDLPWEPVPANNAYVKPGSPDQYYYWFPIGTTSIIWETPITPPPPNVCKELSSDLGAAVEINEKTAYPVNVDGVTFEPVNELPDGLKIKYTTNDNTGKFYADLGAAGLVAQNGVSTTQIKEVQVFYVPGNNGVNDTITVEVTGIDQALIPADSDCDTRFTIREIPRCTDLLVNHQEPIFKGHRTSFISIAKDGENEFPTKIVYSVDDNKGEFSLNPIFNNFPANPGQDIIEFAEPVAFLNFIKNTFDGGAKDKSLTPNYGLASVLALVPGGFDSFEIDQPSAVDLKPKDLLLEDLVDDSPFGPDIADFVGLNTIEVNQNQKVYFHAKEESNGVDVIHVKAKDADSALCEEDYPIDDFQFCEELKVNHEEPIYEQRVTSFIAKAEDDDGDNFNGEITYSVDAGHGQFFLEDPELANNSDMEGVQQVNEFDANQPIPVPQGGFCSDPKVKKVPFGEDAGGPVFNGGFGTSTYKYPGLETKTKDGKTVIPGSEFSELETKYKIQLYGDIASGDFYKSNQYTGTYGNVYKYGGALNYEFKDNSYVISGNQIKDLEVDQTVNLMSDIATGKFFNATRYIDDFEVKDIKTDINKQLMNNVFEAVEVLPDGTVPSAIAPGPMSIVAGELEGIQVLGPENALIDFLEAEQIQGESSVTVAPGTRVWFLATEPGEAVIHVTTACTKDCEKDFDIIPLPRSCANIEIDVTNQPPLPDPLEAGGDPAQMTIINAIDSEGDPLAPETKIIWSTNTGGKLSYQPDNLPVAPVIELDGNIEAKLSEIVGIENYDNEGGISARIAPNDPMFNVACFDEIPVSIREVQNVCTAVNYELSEYGQDAASDHLEANKVYSVAATGTFNPPQDNTVDLIVDENYAAFVKIDNPLLKAIIVAQIKQIQTADQLTMATLTQALPANSVSTTVTVTPEDKAILATFSETPGTADDILRIRVTGEQDNPDCNKTVPFEEKPGICEQLFFTPAGGNFDPTEDLQVFNIEGDFDKHDGEIKANITGCGDLTKFGEENYDEEITFSAEEVKNSNNTLSFVYKRDASCDLDTTDVEINVEAVGAGPECKDSTKVTPDVQECIDLEIVEPNRPWDIDTDEDIDDREENFQIKVTTKPAGQQDELKYNWRIGGLGEWEENGDDELITEGDLTTTLKEFDEGTVVEVWALDKDGKKIEDEDGNQICYDYIKAKTDEKDKPKIDKFAFIGNDLDDPDEDVDVINIGENTSYITYAVVFEANNDVDIVEIWDSFLDAGKIDGSLDGDLRFKGMRINVIKDGDNEGETLLLTDDYEDTNSDDKLFDDDAFEDIEYYDEIDEEDEPDCENEDYDDDKICLEDYEDALETFWEGGHLKFQNVKNYRIIIKYQMLNRTEINDETCKELVANFGCGEQFFNQANFEAESDSDSELTYKDKSKKVKVIAICPYVLSRGGGDVFFHDIIDTGVDVSQCAPVKSCEGGICITPKKETPPNVPKTGLGDTGELPTLALDQPTNDICRYSNLETNISGYDNPLKHFSSTICELQAEVAEEWKEKNISNSIKKNLNLVAKFGQNVTSGTVNSIDQLKTFDNYQSGVFVRKNADLHINFGANKFKGSDKLPAAQTFIVQGANLYIDSNVEYDNSVSISGANPKSIPSLAFIVIDGNIIIDGDVQNIDGIVMAVDTNGSGDGQVRASGEVSLLPLTIKGSLIGDVYDLFDKRKGIGDPTKDQGSVTVFYDERVILNTPPGISSLIDVQQAIVPN
ncbi:hypothetical protein HY605_00885 [Candidatus Peregrinibacteria bacterium]|nr:hypothetical protein [Candidatus Peregrinibacteria bacterium]